MVARIADPQEILTLEFLSSLCLDGTSCQLPDATVTSSWHSLRQLYFYIEGGRANDPGLEQALDAIISLPHLESLGCCLDGALPAQFSALGKLSELKIQLPYDMVYGSLQVSHLSFPGQSILHRKRRLCRTLFGVLQELSDVLQQFFQGLTSLHLQGYLLDVPRGVMSLRGLQELDMSCCSLISLPDGPYLQQLSSLTLDGNSFSVVPRSIAACRCLCALSISGQANTTVQFGEGMGRVLGRLTNLTFLGLRAKRDNLGFQSDPELADFVSTRVACGAWQQCKVVFT